LDNGIWTFLVCAPGKPEKHPKKEKTPRDLLLVARGMESVRMILKLNLAFDLRRHGRA
jgi:hypothetical protein